jgi:TPR repeat protein
MYECGLGVNEPQNCSEAAKWYQMAADSGNAQAQYSLGLLYYEGCGISRNEVLAYMWCDLAAEQGDERAVSDCKLISGNMTAAQMAEAQELIKKWNRNKDSHTSMR